MEPTTAILVLLVTALIYFARYIKKSYSFWSDCGVKTPPFSYIWGHSGQPFFKGPIPERVKSIYSYLKSNNLKHGGFYMLQNPIYVTMDLDICKAILQTDFQYFTDRNGHVIEDDPLTAHLLNLKGQKWKSMRRKLTPAFTSGKMKMMFETMLDCSHGLKKVMDKLEGTEVDIKDVLGRFTTDIIGSCAFGIECNSLENPDNDFRQKGKAAFERPRTVWYVIYEKLFVLFPNLMKLLNLKFVRKDITKFFMRIVTETVEYREKNGIVRKDLLDLLIQLKNKGTLVDDDGAIDTDFSGDNQLSLCDIVAQSYLFFEAGFETASTGMTFCLYELASNKDIQDKLRKEIIKVLKKYDDKITYDAIMEMPYLDMVLQESLRKYPPITGFPRVCTKKYHVPGTKIVLDKGAIVLIPVLGYHHDPLYYPDPSRFDPERFSDENKNERHPMAYLPFGEGPRMCIGMRFGLLEEKIGVITLLRNYEFEVGSKTREPLEWDSKSLVMTALGEIWLKHRRIRLE